MAAGFEALRPLSAPRGKLSVCVCVCVCLCVCVCVFVFVCVFVIAPPSLGLSRALWWLLAPPRAALCDVAGYSQCLNVLHGASVQRGPLKATHFSPAVRDPQAVKRCTLSRAKILKVTVSCVWGGVVRLFRRGQHCLLMDWWLGYIAYLPSLGISHKYAAWDVISLQSEHQYSTEIVTSVRKSGLSRHNNLWKADA